MKSYVAWIIILCFVTGLIGIFVLLKKMTSGTPLADAPATTIAPVVASSTTAKSPQKIPAGYKEYRNKHYGFSVYYPAEIPPQELPDRDDQLTVLFQGAAGEPGFEIYVAPTKDTAITPERFKLDQPSGVMKERHDTMIDGVPATAFVGFNAAVGKTSEVWFIHNGYLFEVATYKELDSWLSDIMQTWRFI